MIIQLSIHKKEIYLHFCRCNVSEGEPSGLDLFFEEETSLSFEFMEGRSFHCLNYCRSLEA